MSSFETSYEVLILDELKAIRQLLEDRVKKEKNEHSWTQAYYQANKQISDFVHEELLRIRRST